MVDVRVLWEHSAAWMAVETFVAVFRVVLERGRPRVSRAQGRRSIPEQLYVAGHFPWVLDEAGSRVAAASELAVRMVRSMLECMFTVTTD